MPGLDHLLFQNELADHARRYLIAKKVAGRAGKTLDSYGRVLGYFVGFSERFGLSLELA